MFVGKLLSFAIRIKHFLPSAFYRSLWLRYWQAVHRIEHAEYEEISSAIQGSERAELIERICEQHPFSSVLEIGCSYGQNFHALSEFFPRARLLGIDADRDRIAGGNEHLVERGVRNAELVCKRSDQLQEFEDNSFDLIITCAFMLYIEPEEIQVLAREMQRIAKRSIILMEQHSEALDVAGTYFPPQKGAKGYWLRNYHQLFPEQEVRITNVPSPRWTTEQWADYATVIEVTL